MAYQWKNNLACKATYMIHTDLLDQISPMLAPMESAGTYKIEYMTGFPDDASSKIKEKWAKQMSAKFIQYALKFYDIQPQYDGSTVRRWHAETWALYKDGERTLTDIAEIMDNYCKFADE